METDPYDDAVAYNSPYLSPSMFQVDDVQYDGCKDMLTLVYVKFTCVLLRLGFWEF